MHMTNKIDKTVLIGVAQACGLDSILEEYKKELNEFANILFMMERDRCAKIFESQAEEYEEKAKKLRITSSAIRMGSDEP